MEGVMRQLVSGIEGRGDADTPQTRAQAMLDQAFEVPDARRRVQLARQALDIWPDCADAYVLLAENASSHKEALDLYRQGVAAGERALGPRAFQEGVGHFWGILETRPYMRAREGLAMSLWTGGQREEAAQHLQEMLRLNPNDNQGVRYALAGFLLGLDRDADLAPHLEQHADDVMASWAYTRALLAFRQHGDTPEARRLLGVALKKNKHVPAYLMGEKHPPSGPPGYWSPGQESEALEYIRGFLVGWKSTPGAVAWLRANVQGGKKEAEAPRPKGPLSFIKKWLVEHLPQEEDDWQADFRQLPGWIQVGGQKVRPWAILVASQSHDLVLAHDMAKEEPPAALLWDTVVTAMRQPAAGESHRPTVLQVRPGEPWDSLRSAFEDIGVSLEATEELGLMDTLLEELVEHLGVRRDPGLLDVPGVTPERAAAFYEAAAQFYRRAPWRKVGYESAIRVECSRFQSGPWYAVLMGQSGLTFGLTLYEDLNLLRRLWASDLGDEENARQSVATTVMFGEEVDVPVGDVEAARRYGWLVAGPEAYPSAFHKERGLSMRPPLAWELELLKGCLRAVPDFVDRRRQDDPTAEEVTVPAAGGELKMTLAWVAEGE
jgi:tetratricopeptide (TPR) repeat protein